MRIDSKVKLGILDNFGAHRPVRLDAVDRHAALQVIVGIQRVSSCRIHAHVNRPLGEHHGFLQSTQCAIVLDAKRAHMVDVGLDARTAVARGDIERTA